MPNNTTFEEGLRLARELAPLLARVPRRTVSVARVTEVPKPAIAYGALIAYVRYYLDLPEATRPRIHDFCLAHDLGEGPFNSSITDERKVRANPVALAKREMIESLARSFLRLHATHDRATRSRFAQAHGVDPRAFSPALRRVEYLDAFSVPNAQAKGRAA